MNVNTMKMEEYAQFLEEKSRNIIELCNHIQEDLIIAMQCMDQQSGQGAAMRMGNNIENIKRSVPVSDDAARRLVLSKKYVDSAGSIFRR